MRCIITPRGDIRKFLSTRFLTTLGKLTYSAYVLHDVVMRFILLNESYNTRISPPTFFMYVYIVTVLAFIGGLVVFLVIEQPMIQLLKPVINKICPVRKVPEKLDQKEQ
uniref:Acyltransferase 3 domain-containing protein n=1 Tax=Anopheles maculatus TaxID=74869 RepID=A0A182SM26_9DIPT